MQRLYANCAGSIGGVLQELQTCTAEPLLLLEDALVADGDLKGCMVRGVKARLRDIWELEDLAPLEVVALDVVGIVDGVCGVGVELGRVSGPGSWDTTVEDDGALDVCARVGARTGGSEGAGSAEDKEEGLHCRDGMGWSGVGSSLFHW